MNCIFCKLISGEKPSMKVYEDEYTMAFMDIAKDVDGHMLVVPKKHIENIMGCDNETLMHLMNTVKLISSHCVESCGYDGINILNASGESAGQSVPHFHMHIIPRKNNDGIDAWPVLGGAKLDITALHNQLKMTE